MQIERLQHHKRASRSGVTSVEAAFVIGLFLMLVFGMCDLGIALLQQNSLAEATRIVAREVAVHGTRAAPELAVWGPATWDGNAADVHAIAAMANTVLVAMDPAGVAITVEWIDGGCSPGDRVRVTLATTHQLLIPLPGYSEGIELTSQSIVPIVH